MQAFEGQPAHHLRGLEPEHVFRAGVECVDDTAQIRGNDRDLGGGVQHTAQLTMGPTQLLLAQT